MVQHYCHGITISTHQSLVIPFIKSYNNKRQMCGNGDTMAILNILDHWSTDTSKSGDWHSRNLLRLTEIHPHGRSPEVISTAGNYRGITKINIPYTDSWELLRHSVIGAWQKCDQSTMVNFLWHIRCRIFLTTQCGTVKKNSLSKIVKYDKGLLSVTYKAMNWLP